MVKPNGENLIFVLSQPRSGSTLLQSLLARNPEVHTTSEPWVALAPCFALRGQQARYGADLGQLALLDFCQSLPRGRSSYFFAVSKMLAELYNQSLSTSDRGDGEPKTRFLDKTPRYYFILEELQLMFPEAKFVALFRNPLAVLASVLDTWGDSDGDVLVRYADDLTLAPAKLTLAACDPDFIRVSYEDLVEHPDAVVSSVCGRLGLQYSPDMLNYQQASVRLRGTMGDRKVDGHTKPHANSLDRWKTVLKGRRRAAEKYLDTLGDHVIRSMGYSASALRKELNEL